MIKSERGNLGLYVVIFILIAIHISIPATSRLLPAVDQPMHLASVTIIKNFNVAEYGFNKWFYLKNLDLQPNSVFRYIAGSSLFPSVETGAKAFFMLYLVLLPLSLLLVIKKFGGNPVYALFGFFLLYHHNVIWGFTNFYMSVPVLLFFIMALHDYLYRERPHDAVFLIIMFCIMFIVHGLTIIITLALFGIALLWRYFKEPKKMLLKALGALPVILLFLRWILLQGGEEKGGGNIKLLIKNIIFFYRDDYLASIPLRLGIIYRENWLYDNHFWGKVLAASFIVLMLVIMIWHLDRGKLKIRNLKPQDPAALPVVLLGAVLLIWFFVPAARGFVSFSYQRMGIFIFLFAILAGSVHAAKPLSKYVVMGLVLVCLVHAALWADYFRDFNRDNREFTAEFLPDADPDKVLIGMVFKPAFRGHFLYIHFPCYYTVWKQGIASPRFTALGGIWRVGANRELPEYVEWLYRRYYKHDKIFASYKNADYLLVRREMTPLATEYFGHFDLVRKNKNWQLWQQIKE